MLLAAESSARASLSLKHPRLRIERKIPSKSFAGKLELAASQLFLLSAGSAEQMRGAAAASGRSSFAALQCVSTTVFFHTHTCVWE